MTSVRTTPPTPGDTFATAHGIGRLCLPDGTGKLIPLGGEGLRCHLAPKPDGRNGNLG
jgi:hypothetical protein